MLFTGPTLVCFPLESFSSCSYANMRVACRLHCALCQHFITKVVEQLSGSKIQEMTREADPDKNGTIHYKPCRCLYTRGLTRLST